MTAVAKDAEYEALRVFDAYAHDLRDFLESVPTHLQWERFDQLRERCGRLLANVPRPWNDEPLKGAWARTQQRLAELHEALNSQSPRARIISLYDDLGRAYEQCLAAFRQRAVALDLHVPVRASSVKTLIRARTLFHVASGLGAAILYQTVLSRAQAMAVLLSLLSVVIGLEVSRRLSGRFNHFLLNSPVFHPIARPREYHAVNSSTWYLIALSAITPLFSRSAVCQAALILAFADPAAAWIGRKYGRTRLFRQKSVVGSFAFLVVAFTVACAFLLSCCPGLSTQRVLLTAVVAAVAGTLTELFSERIDDNLTIPIASALAASLLV